MTVSLLNKVENIVAKGEVAHHEQFHLWSQVVFKRRLLRLRQNASVCGKGLNSSIGGTYVNVLNGDETAFKSMTQHFEHCIQMPCRLGIVYNNM